MRETCTQCIYADNGKKYCRRFCRQIINANLTCENFAEWYPPYEKTKKKVHNSSQ